MEESARVTFKRELEALQTIRDELKVKAHLARKEVHDEIGLLEEKYRLVDEMLDRAKANVKVDVGRIGGDIKALLVDLRQGYEAVRRRFES